MVNTVGTPCCQTLLVNIVAVCRHCSSPSPSFTTSNGACTRESGDLTPPQKRLARAAEACTLPGAGAATHDSTYVWLHGWGHHAQSLWGNQPFCRGASVCIGARAALKRRTPLMTAQALAAEADIGSRAAYVSCIGPTSTSICPARCAACSHGESRYIHT